MIKEAETKPFSLQKESRLRFSLPILDVVTLLMLDILIQLAQSIPIPGVETAVDQTDAKPVVGITVLM